MITCFGLANAFFDVLEIFNICNISISIFVSFLENCFCKPMLDFYLQELESFVHEGMEFFEIYLSFRAFFNQIFSVHGLERHLSTMSFEQKVTLNK